MNINIQKFAGLKTFKSLTNLNFIRPFKDEEIMFTEYNIIKNTNMRDKNTIGLPKLNKTENLKISPQNLITPGKEKFITMAVVYIIIIIGLDRTIEEK